MLVTVLLKGRNALLSTKIWKYLFYKTVQGVGNLENINSQTILFINFWENCENRYCSAFPQAM